MEGDAGASRLNPPPMPTNRRLRRRHRTFKAADQSSPEVETEDSSESEGGTGQIAPVVETEDSSESEGGTDETTPEVETEDSSESEGGTDQTSPEVETEDSSESEGGADETTPEVETEDSSESEGGAGVERGPSRLARRGWLAGIAAALVLSAAAIGTGGYFALRYHHEAQAIARNDAAALKAAVDCVSATQAPDTTAMAASEQKIIDCGTDAFRSQAVIYTSMIVQAYQAANIHVQVADVRAAVERNNNDGSVDVLVALRVKVASDQSQKETGYRLRVTMALADGQYKISKLDQVTK